MQFPLAIACEVRVLRKLYRQPFQCIDKRKATLPLRVVHSGIIGPMRTASLGGKRFATTFTDELTKYTMAYFPAKSEAPAMVAEYT